jgi:hypothetical protein
VPRAFVILREKSLVIGPQSNAERKANKKRIYRSVVGGSTEISASRSGTVLARPCCRCDEKHGHSLSTNKGLSAKGSYSEAAGEAMLRNLS